MSDLLLCSHSHNLPRPVYQTCVPQEQCYSAVIPTTCVLPRAVLTHHLACFLVSPSRHCTPLRNCSIHAIYHLRQFTLFGLQFTLMCTGLSSRAEFGSYRMAQPTQWAPIISQSHISNELICETEP